MNNYGKFHPLPGERMKLFEKITTNGHEYTRISVNGYVNIDLKILREKKDDEV
jgi:hypothetical protein